MTDTTNLPDHPKPLQVDDVTNALRKQHDEARTALDEVLRSFGYARTDSLHALKMALACHETAEQLVVHPVAAALAGDTPVPAERVEEESAAGEMIGQLETCDVDSDEFTTKFRELAADVREHADREEEQEWPRLSSLDDQQVIEQMFAVVEIVPELARHVEGPTSAASFQDMLEWAEEQLKTRFPGGVDLDRLAAPEAGEQVSPAVETSGDAGDKRSRKGLFAAGGAALAAGGFALGRRRARHSSGTGKSGKPDKR